MSIEESLEQHLFLVIDNLVHGLDVGGPRPVRDDHLAHRLLLLGPDLPDLPPHHVDHPDQVEQDQALKSWEWGTELSFLDRHISIKNIKVTRILHHG